MRRSITATMEFSKQMNSGRIAFYARMGHYCASSMTNGIRSSPFQRMLASAPMLVVPQLASSPAHWRAQPEINGFESHVPRSISSLAMRYKPGGAYGNSAMRSRTRGTTALGLKRCVSMTPWPIKSIQPVLGEPFHAYLREPPSCLHFDGSTLGKPSRLVKQ